MEGDASATAFLGSGVTKLDHRPNASVGIQHHIPSKFGDFARPHSCLDRQQDDDAVAERVASNGCEGKEVFCVKIRKDFGLLARPWSTSKISRRLL
jgi:hypothetical protein